MTHNSKVRVNLSVSMEIATDSHPEDISEVAMKHILAEALPEHLESISLHQTVTSWEFEDIKAIE
jgi:hypothetical protein